MEALSFEAISSAQPLLFRVGPNRREFFIHSALVASLSPSLRQLVEGPWEESTSGVVEWKDVDEATFVHFCQFAYTGSFNIQELPSVRPEPEGSNEPPLAPIPEPAPEPETEVYNDDFGWGPPPKPKKKKKDMTSSWGFGEPEERQLRVEVPFTTRLQSILQKVLETQPHYPSKATATVTDEQGVTVCYSYGEIFLAHIHVCLLADCHQIDNLANQALERLRCSFLTSQVENSDVIEVTERYVKGDLPDSLKELVLAYIASQATRMWDDDQFQALLQENAGMAFELLSIVMEAAKA